MGLFDPEDGRVAIYYGAHETAVGEVSGPYLSASQVIKVFEVDVVTAVVKHVYHFVGQNALYETRSS